MSNTSQQIVNKGLVLGGTPDMACSVRCAHDLADAIARTAHATPHNEIKVMR